MQMSAPLPTVPSILLPELLGFSPQLLLDDIINIANDAVTVSVNGMEEFLIRWADTRAAKPGTADWDSTQEVEQGLVAFQTLLESHADIAFDYLEVWSLRNIFAFPPDLPIVTPHHKGLELQVTEETEKELTEGIEDLRRQIDNQRRLQRLLTRAVRKSAIQLRRSQKRVENIYFLQSPDLQTMASLPSKLSAMFQSVSSLPRIDPTDIPVPPTKDPGRREWETNKTGYLNWAASMLMKKPGAETGGEIGKILAVTEKVGQAAWIKAALEVEGTPVGAPDGSHHPDGEETMETELDQ